VKKKKKDNGKGRRKTEGSRGDHPSPPRALPGKTQVGDKRKGKNLPWPYRSMGGRNGRKNPAEDALKQNRGRRLQTKQKSQRQEDKEEKRGASRAQDLWRLGRKKQNYFGSCKVFLTGSSTMEVRALLGTGWRPRKRRDNHSGLERSPKGAGGWGGGGRETHAAPERISGTAFKKKTEERCRPLEGGVQSGLEATAKKLKRVRRPGDTKESAHGPSFSTGCRGIKKSG